MKLHFDSKQVFQIEAVIVITNILCAMAMFLSSCIQDNPIPFKSIKVGVLLGFTGTGSQNASETKAALDVCLDDISQYILRNGIDATLDLYYEDTKSDTTEAKIRAQSLIDRGVSLIIGPYTSTETKAVKSIADAKNVLLVSHSAVSTALAIPNDNLLRFVPSDTYQAEAVNAMFMMDSIQSIIPVVRNDLWSNSLAAETIRKFEEFGGVPYTTQSFEPGTTDFSSLISEVKTGITKGTEIFGSNRIAVYLISYTDGTAFLEALSKAGLTESIKIYGASAFAQSASLTANLTAAEFACNSMIQCPVFGFDESASNIYEPIQQRIISLIGTRASIYALAAYDILWVTLLTVLTQQSQPDFQAFKAHFIETTGDYFGATGRTELDEYGDRKHVYYDFWTIKNENGIYSWRLSAKYNTTDHTLSRVRAVGFPIQ
jgi:branched-chain amino acid transport system substrate-binding protein